MATTKTKKATKTTDRKPRAKPRAADPEVLPKEESASAPAVYQVRSEEFKPALDNLESCLRSDITKQKNFDKASAMMTIKIGLGLQFAKGLIKHGNYEDWVEYKFGEMFSKRNAQYASKLAKKFLASDAGRTLQLPAPQEGGSFLILANENSDNQLFRSVQDFVGDKTLPDLYAEHGIKAQKPKAPGGWRPATRLIELNQLENAHLRGKEFEVWPPEDKEAFKDWHTAQLEADTSVGETIAAEGAWASIRKQLTKHGLEDKDYAHLTDSMRAETADLLMMVSKAICPKKK